MFLRISNLWSHWELGASILRKWPRPRVIHLGTVFSQKLLVLVTWLRCWRKAKNISRLVVFKKYKTLKKNLQIFLRFLNLHIFGDLGLIFKRFSLLSNICTEASYACQQTPIFEICDFGAIFSKLKNLNFSILFAQIYYKCILIH